MTRTTHPRTVATLVAGAVLLAACGTSDDDGSTADGAADDLRAPVAVEVAAAGRDVASASPRELLDPVEGDQFVDPAEGELTTLPWFGGFDYEVGEGLPPLPTTAVGYEFPAGTDVGVDEVARIAEALGVPGEPQRGSGREGDGTRWRVGPDDGTAPSLVVVDDGQLGWYVSGAWADTAFGEPCEVVVGDDGEVVEERCAEPAPPVGVPTGAEAEHRARDLLTALGQEPSAFELETFADEWSASVTAWLQRDGVRWPLGFGFGFGGEGVLQWANGWLAEPVAAGPYPLVDLDGALGRLDDQRRMWTAVEMIDDMSGDTAGEPATEDELPGEPTGTAVLVDVRADLWWVYDVDGSIWLLPAYTFVDTDGRTHTVPAVTDEFLIVDEHPGVEEPMPVEPMPVEPMPVEPMPVEPMPVEPGDPDPIAPDPLDPLELDALDRDALVGATVEEATAVLEADGLSLRVARLDGEDLALTMDFVPTRVNVAVEGDVVVELLSVG